VSRESCAIQPHQVFWFGQILRVLG